MSARLRARLGRRRDADTDRGAVLVLALVFVFVVGLTIGAIVSLVGANLFVTQGLQQQRGLEYGAGAAIEGAIQAIRYDAPPSPPSCPSFPTSGSLPMNNKSFVVVCSMGVPPGFYGRVVEFDACLAANGSSFSQCQSNAIVQANVVFNDVKPGCLYGSSPGCYGSSWGTGVTITGWNVKPADG